MIPVPSPYEAQLERLREHSGYRVSKAPWGWTAYKPGAPSDQDVRAADLDELEAVIMPPAGDDGDAATLPRRKPPAGS